MKLSIIIPTLNEEAVIGSSVDHAWAADPAEVIVVDGGSRDRTRAAATRHGARVLGSPRGRAVQQNRGARAARGNVLLFLHADNWLHPSGAHQVGAALADGSILGGAFRQRIESDGALFRILERGNAFRAARCGLPYGDQGLFLRQDFFQRLGGFPEVPIMEDLLLMRAFRAHSRPVLLPGPIHVSARRWQQVGVVRQTLRNWQLLAMERVGVPPESLVRFYRPHTAPAHRRLGSA